MSVKDYPTRLAAGYYRVRKSWEDAESQLGQFRLLSSAIAILTPVILLPTIPSRRLWNMTVTAMTSRLPMPGSAR